MRSLPLLLASAGVAVVAATAYGVGVLQEEPTPPPPASAAMTWSLEDVPGFGRSTSAMDRDDQIAAYQAFLREEFVATCMRDRGFEYRVDLRYPTDSLVKMSVPEGNPEGGSSISASAQNRKYVAGLSSSRRDDYYQALLAESAEDMEKFQSGEGVIPDGTDPDKFATGGCTGAATAEVGRIWDVRDDLADDWDRARAEARTSTLMTAASEDLRACAERFGLAGVDEPQSIDDLVVRGPVDPEALREVEQECLPEWQKQDDAALLASEADFIAEHKVALEGQLDRYGDLFARSQEDVAFGQLVAEEIAAAK